MRLLSHLHVKGKPAVRYAASLITLFTDLVYITRLASKEIFSPSNKLYREVGRAKDLSAPRYWPIAMKVATCADNAQRVEDLNLGENPFISRRDTQKILHVSSGKLPLFTNQSQRNS